MEIAKSSVFQGQETLLARGRFPGSVFHKPETLFARVSKLKKNNASKPRRGGFGGQK